MKRESPTGWKTGAALLLLAPLLAGCGGGTDQQANTSGPPRPAEELYNNGMDALAANRYATAADQFNSIEQNYPFSQWASRAELMLGYTQYLQNNYDQAISTLDRYIQLHPTGPDIAYVYYLRALCYYEQIADVQRDQKMTVEAMRALQEVADRHALCDGRAAEDRPLPRPSGRQGDGDRPLVRGPASL
jgi:outer membrane protein assembly factor BamD